MIFAFGDIDGAMAANLCEVKSCGYTGTWSIYS